MDLRGEAERWLAEDPDEKTRAELVDLLQRDDREGLAERFGQRLEFGTAGIRGRLGAGPNRMNRAVVRRVTAGLAAYLNTHVPAVAARGVVVGRDARHGSAEFAHDAAGVLAGAGIAVWQHPEPVPTPFVAFAVRALAASGGVQITASHNPPSDNGYKVYGPDGALIAPPVDAEISAAVERVGAQRDIPFQPSSPLVQPVPERVRQEYINAALDLLRHPEHRSVRIAYTPLHGVAGDLCVQLLQRAGFGGIEVVGAQAEPDADFPTVAFPNPEQPGVLDHAVTLARETEADIVLANDPDGDRIAVSAPDRDGSWRVLTGDEVGCLLADYLLTGTPGGPERMVATTVVSSRMLALIAAHHGAGYAETLTGFKWLAQVAAQARARGQRLVLAYEQALGVMVGDAVRDKDGMSAALVLAELAAVRKAAGETLLDALDGLARRFGAHATAGWSVHLDAQDGAARVAQTLDRLRSARPDHIGGVAVASFADHAARLRHLADRSVERLTTPPGDLLTFVLIDGSRIQIRPSGTEPLLKLYAEVVEHVAGGDVAHARERARTRLDRLTAAFHHLAFPD